MMVLEIIGRETDENGWNGNESAHKGYDRKYDESYPCFFGNPRFGKLNELINHECAWKEEIRNGKLVVLS